MDYKANSPIKVVYVALGLTTGLTDLMAQPYDEAGAVFGSPTAMTEVGNGIYEVSFTPDAVGNWKIRMTSATNGDDAVKAFKVNVADIDTINTNVGTVETKVDSVQSDVTAVKNKTDNLPADTAQELNDIDTAVSNVQSTVDSINTNIQPGGYFA